MSAINEKYIRGPFKADFQGGIVWGPDGFHFADVRGWGELKYVENGEKIQDANLQFTVDALNEKASGALSASQAEVKELRELLESAQNGLSWYRSEHPEDESPADDELHEKITTALKRKP